MDFRFRPEDRLRRKSEFDAVFDAGRRLRGRSVTLIAAPNDLGRSRVGVVASRRIGGAVLRNRAKRLMREAFRLNRHLIARPMDVILIAQPRTPRTPFSEIEDEVQRFFRSLHGPVAAG